MCSRSTLRREEAYSFERLGFGVMQVRTIQETVNEVRDWSSVAANHVTTLRQNISVKGIDIGNTEHGEEILYAQCLPAVVHGTSSHYFYNNR